MSGHLAAASRGWGHPWNAGRRRSSQASGGRGKPLGHRMAGSVLRCRSTGTPGSAQRVARPRANGRRVIAPLRVLGWAGLPQDGHGQSGAPRKAPPTLWWLHGPPGASWRVLTVPVWAPVRLVSPPRVPASREGAGRAGSVVGLGTLRRALGAERAMLGPPSGWEPAGVHRSNKQIGPQGAPLHERPMRTFSPARWTYLSVGHCGKVHDHCYNLSIDRWRCFRVVLRNNWNPTRRDQ